MAFRNYIAAICAILVLSSAGFGQSYALAPIPKLTGYLSNSGSILSGAKVCSFVAGSSTPQNTFSNSSGTPNTNPMTLDSNGRGNIWINSNAYKFIFYNKNSMAAETCPYNGTTIWTVDGIRDWGLVAIESGVISGSGTAGNCAYWTDTEALSQTGLPCGTVTGTVTSGYLMVGTGTHAIGSSQVYEDLTGGPGSYVLKIGEKLLVNGTTSDQPIGAMVILGATHIANSAANAQTINFSAFGGGGGYAEISSGHTGSGTTKDIKIGFDGSDGVNAFVPAIVVSQSDQSVTIPMLACPMGMTAPVTVDDTGKLVQGSCS
jgi:hypothetical protein